MSRMYFLGEAYDAHRAYGDVLAMEKFFYHQSFCISVIVIKSNNKKCYLHDEYIMIRYKRRKKRISYLGN